jgi:ribosomal protein S18 acetylase RimI-like enzyme
MSNTGIVVRPATGADLSAVAEVLARAFHDDPPMVWMLPDDASRPGRLWRMFRTILRYEAMRHGAVDVAVTGGGDRVVGAAVWYPVDAWRPPPLLRQLRSTPGFLRAFGRRIGVASAMMTSSLRAHPAEPHWYLAFVGVDPATQGSGAGAALLRSRLARIDALGEASFLESSKVVNVPVYEHFGYRVVGTTSAAGGGPVSTAMWRDPGDASE